MKRLKNLILESRKAFIVITHILIVVFSFWIAFLLRFDLSIPPKYLVTFYTRLPLLLGSKIIVFAVFGIFSGLWKYVSMDDAWKIIKANLAATFIFILAEVLFFGLKGFPRTVFMIDWIICASLVGGVRFASRFMRERYYQNYKFESKKILIIGAGEAGIMLLREYRRNPYMGQVIGFMDDDRMKLNESIQGVKILGNRRDIPKIVERYEVEEVVIAMPSVKGDEMRDVLSYCEKTAAKIKITPQLDKLLSGKLVLKPREVQPEDLLGRETVTIDIKDISAYVKDKVVLITGAGGSIGSEIARQIARFEPKEVILFDHHENFVYFLTIEFKVKYPKVKIKTFIGDIRDVGLLKQLFSKNKPEVVFHAAAHKHVPLMEENPVAAVKNNILGSRNLIYAAHHYGVERFVLISTDKAVNPISVMGMSKRIAEMILQAKAKGSKVKFMAVRFGNVLGSSGSVVPLFKKQIAEGGPVTITHPDVERYFMSVREAVMLVLQAGAIGRGGELFILDMGEQIKIIDIARNLIALSGLTPDKDIKIKFVGLRAGEKLREELLLDKEKDAVTKHEKIYVNQPQEFDASKLRKEIKKLESLANVMNSVEIVKKMKDIIG
ncbi:MAG: nucleoside-diphosphate sugar epimerase/dehydratase [Phycisphaerae bacterium]|jgi:FlaA1/EpsC-like NDP-sugar epimerase